MKRSWAASTKASRAPALGRPRACRRLASIGGSIFTDYQSVKPNTKIEERGMNTYVIRREKAWLNGDELEAAAGRSKEVAESDFPQDISWIRSYVIAEPGGTLGTVCIYQASGPEAAREHAQRVGMPAGEVLQVADTVVIRPDPPPEAASA